MRDDTLPRSSCFDLAEVLVCCLHDLYDTRICERERGDAQDGQELLSSVWEKCKLSYQKDLFFLEEIGHWISFPFEKSCSHSYWTYSVVNVLSLSSSRLYYVFLLMYLKTTNRWRMF